MPTSLTEWIDYIQTLHHREIELSLERVAEVYRRMYPEGVNFRIVNIAGTNGKGSTAELINSIYCDAGFKVGKYTSPHISRFNERYNLNRKDVDDQQLLSAFARVEEARGTTTLTFFEFGTLLAIDLFARAGVDIAVMEVGLGGRLDAVNILDPDLAVVTSISIDHTAWLGDTIEQIAGEKIAIARAQRPCVIGMLNPPASMVEYCRQLEIKPLVYGVDFFIELDQSDQHCVWRANGQVIESLPLPFGQRGHQLQNAATAIQSVLALTAILPVSEQAIATGIARARAMARCQLLGTAPHVVLDVAHNVDSVAGLLVFLKGLNVQGRIYAVCGMLADKQIAETLAQLVNTVDEWHFTSIDHPRGASAERVDNRLRAHLADHAGTGGIVPQKPNFPSYHHDSASDAYTTVRGKLKKNDCLVVFGSFFIASDIIDLI